MKKLFPLLMAAILILCSACSNSKPSVAASETAAPEKSSDEITVGAQQDIGESSPENAVSSGAALFQDVFDAYMWNMQGEYRENYQNVSYALYDIDGNGVEELLVRYSDSLDEYIFLYTCVNGINYEIGDFWSRYYLMLDGKGNIYVNGDSGYDQTTIYSMRISDDSRSLTTVEAWEMDGDTYMHYSPNGDGAISKGEFESAQSRISKATDGFVESLHWQSLDAVLQAEKAPAEKTPVEILYAGIPLSQFMELSEKEVVALLGKPVSDHEGM